LSGEKADRAIEGVRCRCVLRCHVTKVRGDGDSQGLRHRLEAGALPEQRVELVPAGLEKSIGVISSQSNKDPNDPRWSDDPRMLEWRAFMRKYLPEGNPADILNFSGYGAAAALVHVLRQCGDDLTRENVMRQAASFKNFVLPTLLPGITLNTSPSDFAPTKSLQPVRFDGKTWVPFGDVMGL